MNLHPFLIREEVMKEVRSFFSAKQFHEVLTPILHTSIPAEPHIYPFSTQWNTRTQKTDLYLSTSPERGMKRILAEGIGNCFTIGKCFRNLEAAGSRHIPEYLMLEWYRTNATYKDIMQDMQELIQSIKKRVDIFHSREQNSTLTYQGKAIRLDTQWETHSLPTLFKTHAGLSLEEILVDKEYLFTAAKKKGYNTTDARWDELFDQMYVQEIESQMPETPYFITDFPAELSPMCAVQNKKPYLAERFEFFLAGIELANGNTENVDVQLMETYLKNGQKKQKSQNPGSPVPPVDTEFLGALTKMHDSGNTFAGVGLGIDRLAMIMADTTEITDVEPFSDLS